MYHICHILHNIPLVFNELTLLGICFSLGTGSGASLTLGHGLFDAKDLGGFLMSKIVGTAVFMRLFFFCAFINWLSSKWRGHNTLFLLNSSVFFPSRSSLRQLITHLLLL